MTVIWGKIVRFPVESNWKMPKFKLRRFYTDGAIYIDDGTKTITREKCHCSGDRRENLIVVSVTRSVKFYWRNVEMFKTNRVLENVNFQWALSYDDNPLKSRFWRM